MLGGLLLLLAAGYAAAYFVAGDKVPRGTTVAGVEVGGMTQDQARTALEDGLADRVDRQITVVHDGQTTTITPADAGLSVDYAASVADAGGEESWSPDRLWTYFTGGDDRDAVVDVDEPARHCARHLVRPGRDSAPRRRGEVQGRPGRHRRRPPGEGFDPETARAPLLDAYLAEDAEDLELPSSPPGRDRRRRRTPTSTTSTSVSSPVLVWRAADPPRTEGLEARPRPPADAGTDLVESTVQFFDFGAAADPGDLDYGVTKFFLGATNVATAWTPRVPDC